MQKICLLGKSEELANRLTQKLSDFISAGIDQLQQEISGPESNELTILKNFWIQFCFQMQSVKDMFLYLERTYLTSE